MFYSICTTIPDLDSPIFTSADDDGKTGVEGGEWNVVCVTFHGLDTAFGEVVPYLDGLVVASGDEVGSVWARIEFDVVDPLFMGVHCEIGGGGGDGPHFDSTV